MAKRVNGEGTIFKRKDGRWCAAYFDEGDKAKRHFVYGKTQKEVKDKLKERQLNNRLEVRAEYKLKDWVKEYLNNYKKNEVKITTYGTYMITFRKHIEEDEVGELLLTKIRPSDLQKYYNRKSEAGYNSKTIRHIKVIINNALCQAVREKLISENPNAYITLPKRKSYQGTILTQEEVRKLVNAAKDDELYPIVMVALFTGMRKGEIMGLQWNKSIDFENSRIHVVQSLCRVVHNNEETNKSFTTYELMEPKTVKSIRDIPMTPLVKTVLKWQQEHQSRLKEEYEEIYEDNDLVFARCDGRYLDQREFMNQYHSFLKRYGVSDCRFHDLRHCFASLLLTTGTGMKVTSDLLGHSTINTSMNIYAHVYDENKIEALEKLEEII